MTWIDCTRTLRPGMIQWPDDPPFEVRRLADMNQGDAANVTLISGCVHLGPSSARAKPSPTCRWKFSAGRPRWSRSGSTAT